MLIKKIIESHRDKDNHIETFEGLSKRIVYKERSDWERKRMDSLKVSPLPFQVAGRGSICDEKGRQGIMISGQGYIRSINQFGACQYRQVFH